MTATRRRRPGSRGRIRHSLLILCVGSALSAGATPVLDATPVLAATPEPSVVRSGDPRSEGEGPGIVGSPLLAAAAVVGLGVLAAGATVVVLRLTRET